MRVARRIAAARGVNAVGVAIVRRLLAGRSDAEIAGRPFLARAARFPILNGLVEVELVDGIRAYVHAPSAPYLFWAGPTAMEPDVVPSFVAAVRQARSVIDVGANFGFYSLLAARLNPRARIVAFEPNPELAAILRETIARNAVDVELRELALSNRSGTVALSLAGGLSSLEPSRWAPGTRVASVETGRFDDVVDGPVDLVKIDAEGAEAAILEGMRGTLERDRPVVFCEVSPETRPAVAAAARAAGYRARLLPARADLDAARLTPGAVALLEPQERG